VNGFGPEVELQLARDDPVPLLRQYFAVYLPTDGCCIAASYSYATKSEEWDDLGSMSCLHGDSLISCTCL